MPIEPPQASSRILNTTVLVALSLLTSPLSRSQTSPDPQTAIEHPSISEAMEKANDDDPSSIYYVERLAESKAVEAIPMLEQKFFRTADPLDKAHVASALVRLGDKNDTYWNFLLEQATKAVESDVPSFYIYDANGKAAGGPSPAYIAWATAHNLPPNETEQPMYMIPGAVALLGITADPRGVPILRRGLLSRNYQIEIVAAMSLAQVGDKNSIPFIIKASEKAPAEVASVLAESLVYFDDPQAQRAVDKFIDPETAKIDREARANGKTKPW